MVQLLRNNFVESLHLGSAVVVGPENNILVEWGKTDEAIFPRSSIKLIQAIKTNNVLIDKIKTFTYKDEKKLMKLSDAGNPIKIIRAN